MQYKCYVYQVSGQLRVVDQLRPIGMIERPYEATYTIISPDEEWPLRALMKKYESSGVRDIVFTQLAARAVDMVDFRYTWGAD